ncbi:MAG TPA: flavodoxin family protein [Candidatus Lokiarchaeia archaeon]|nr:flavodoxin family protein [Candidatus Lokiarchaeia archaeon]
MKILICYHSQTGNTEKVARIIAEALAEEDLAVMPAADVDPATLGDYEMVLLGSGVYAGAIGASIKPLVKQATTLPAQVALFLTHANSNPAMWRDAFKVVRKFIEKAGSAVVAEFDCYGENLTTTVEQRQRLYANLTPEQRELAEAHEEDIRGRPNEEDLDSARAFARALVNPAAIF